jgi:hypothetical protein
MKPVRIGGNDSRQDPPSQPIATLLLFAVSDQMAFALVMRSSNVFSAGDTIVGSH